MLNYITIPVTRYEQNCSIVWCDITHDAAVIDPGGSIDTLLSAVAVRNLRLSSILLTHGHIDHAGGVGELIKQKPVHVIGPQREDLFWLEKLAAESQLHGFPLAIGFEPDRWLNDSDVVNIGRSCLTVHHCPGHTPGHVVFHASEIHRVFVGDVLFVGSIGRTDLPRGDHGELVRSIRTKIWPMGDQTVFIPGHGPEGRVGQERLHNPFVGEGRF